MSLLLRILLVTVFNDQPARARELDALTWTIRHILPKYTYHRWALSHSDHKEVITIEQYQSQQSTTLHYTLRTVPIFDRRDRYQVVQLDSRISRISRTTYHDDNYFLLRDWELSNQLGCIPR